VRLPSRRLLAAALFLGFWFYYQAGAGPGLVAYRDSGEMVVSAWTLGVSHPTGYPLYILLGRLFEAAVPLGNPAYRLSLLSSLPMAAGVALFFSAAMELLGALPAFGAAALLGLSSQALTLARVQEMYALGFLGAAGLMIFALRLHRARGVPVEKEWLGFCFLYGLFLANRLDLLLLAPGLLVCALGLRRKSWLSPWFGLAFLAFPAAMFYTGSNYWEPLLVALTAWLASRSSGRIGWLLKSGAFALLGLSVYLYLPIRSAGHPWLDWNHPAQWSHFIQVLLRSKYGGTLDLISRNYKPGELLGANLLLYGRHLWRDLTPAGAALSLAGLWRQSRRDPELAAGLGAVFWWAGPVFLLLSNMPPNPHAAAIVEPYYLIPDMALAFWAAEGLAWLAARPPGRGLAAALAAFFLLGPFVSGRTAEYDHRDDFFDEDYARNVLASLPKGGVLVAKKDVQLYSLWYRTIALRRRSDATVVAQGLSGAPWYQEQMRREKPRLVLRSLKSPEDWRLFALANAPAYAAMDAEIPAAAAAQGSMRGLLIDLGSPIGSWEALKLWRLFVFRGRYAYEERPDFFSSDLVNDDAQALYRTATALTGRPPLPTSVAALARRLAMGCWALHWLMPDPPAFLGYLAALQGRYKEALGYEKLAESLAAAMLGLTREYHSLPDAVSSVRRSLAEARLQKGIMLAKLGRPEEAKAAYEASLEAYPLGKAHYNLAVYYWDRDRVRAAQELDEAVRLDPSDAQSRRYLEALRRR
jgi:tetratricopeptide (TPR) repeat protein